MGRSSSQIVIGKRTNQTLTKHLNEWHEIQVKKEQTRRANRTKAKTKYNSKNYDILSVRLDKDLVAEFKNKVKELDISQAEIIRSFVEEFINNN